MRKRLILFRFMCCILCFIAISGSAFASELVPYPGDSTTSSSQGALMPTPGQSQVASGGSTSHDYAGEIFTSPTYTEDPMVSSAVRSISTAVSYVFTFVIGVVPHLMALLMLVDICCMLFKPLNVLLTGLPIQLFSDTVTEITGISYAGKTEGGAAASAPQKTELKMPKWLYYLEKKLPELLVAFALFLLLYSGVLFDLLFMGANAIVGVIEGVVR